MTVLQTVSYYNLTDLFAGNEKDLNEYVRNVNLSTAKEDSLHLMLSSKFEDDIVLITVENLTKELQAWEINVPLSILALRNDEYVKMNI